MELFRLLMCSPFDPPYSHALMKREKKTAHESIISLQFANERICTWDLRRIEFDDDDENGDDDEYNMSPYLNSCKKVSFKKFH